MNPNLVAMNLVAITTCLRRGARASLQPTLPAAGKLNRCAAARSVYEGDILEDVKTEKEKLYALLERQGATGLMNNTKWGEAIQALKKLPLRYRVKFITVDEVSDWTWLIYTPPHYIEIGSWAGISTLLEIEWLEVNTIEKKYRGQLIDDEQIIHTSEVERILSALHVPFSKEEAIIRIWGHLLKVE